MTDKEEQLLRSLASMCEQYLGSGTADWLDHEAMSAGEEAVRLLVEYGLVDPSGRGGSWTEVGKLLLTRSA